MRVAFPRTARTLENPSPGAIVGDAAVGACAGVAECGGVELSKDAQGSISLVLSIDGKPVRLTSPDKWARAVRQGDLRPESLVEVEREGEPTARLPAGELPELRGVFEAAGVQLRAPEEPATQEQPEAPAVDALGGDDPAPASAAKPRRTKSAPPPQPGDAAETSAPPTPPKAAPARGSGMKVVLGLAAVLGVLWLIGTLGAEKTEEAPPASTAPAATAQEVTAAPAARPIEAGAFVEWEAGRDGDPALYQIGDLTIALAVRPDDAAPIPVLRVQLAGRPPQEHAGVGGFSEAKARFAVGQLDPSTPEPEILFATFSGGAHCCTKLSVLQLQQGDWRVIELGDWDGEPAGEWPKDVDRDGTPDLVMSDQSFLYAFGPYAESVTPLQVINVRDGLARDVTSKPGFSLLHEAELSHTMRSCFEHSNPACAAFVANAARLGRAPWAWQIMLEQHNTASDWDLPTGCAAARVEGRCPPGQEIVYSTYPEALAAFLIERGYLPADFLAPAA